MKATLVLLGLYFIMQVWGGSVTLGVNEIPEWDLCVNGGDIFSCSGHGACSGGKCVCTDGYTGRDCSLPPGGFAYPTPATVTQFCQLETGGCAAGMCVGGGQFDSSNLPPGVDGVAALNPTLYGSRYAYAAGNGMGVPQTLNGQYSFVGQSCGTCWKLTRGSVSITVTVVDRCAGYCRATQTDPQSCSTTALGGKECGECIQAGQASTPQCSCLNTASYTGGFCGGQPTAHCDWCAANDHPHFDLDITAQTKICGADAFSGVCSLDSFQMVACPDMIGPWPNGYFNKTKAPSTSSTNSGGSTNSAPSGGNVDLATSCGPVLDATTGTCKAIAQGGYHCNAGNLTMCNLGKFMNLGCPAGTVCQSGACVLGTKNDIPLTSCNIPSTPAPTSAPNPPAATTKPTSAPNPPAATTKPTSAPNPPAATTKPTSAPPPPAGTTKPVPTPAPTQKATSAPATPAPSTTTGGKKCRRKITTTPPVEVVDVEEITKTSEPTKEEVAAAEPSPSHSDPSNANAAPVSAAARSLSSVFYTVLGIFVIITLLL